MPLPEYCKPNEMLPYWQGGLRVNHDMLLAEVGASTKRRHLTCPRCGYDFGMVGGREPTQEERAMEGACISGRVGKGRRRAGWR